MQRTSISIRLFSFTKGCVLAAISAIMPLAAHSAPASLAVDAQLRVDRYLDAETLAQLAKGTRVDTLKSEAGWIKVRVGVNVGWLRASQLTSSAPHVSARAKDGRTGLDNVMAISGLRSMPPAPGHALASLAAVYAQRAVDRKVSVAPDEPVLRIGRDALDFSVTSSHAGYLYLIMLGSDNKSFYVLFPNGFDQDNAIKAGQTMKLPRKNWEIKAQGPAGIDKMLVIVTDSPRDLSGLKKSGPFFTLQTDANGIPELKWISNISTGSSAYDCQHEEPQSENNANRHCAAKFGSALINILEK